jgi:hypothetical protein
LDGLEKISSAVSCFDIAQFYVIRMKGRNGIENERRKKNGKKKRRVKSMEE